jgi:hypothetical protein
MFQLRSSSYNFCFWTSVDHCTSYLLLKTSIEGMITRDSATQARRNLFGFTRKHSSVMGSRLRSKPATGVKRRTRSRYGCAQCVKVSRKCDEKRPICGRCERLQYDCDTRPRLIWKVNTLETPVSSALPDLGEGVHTACTCLHRPNSEQLLQLCEFRRRSRDSITCLT